MAAAQPNFAPPPTYADVVVVDPTNQKQRFNPIWLDWFLSLAQVLTNSGAASGTINHNTLGNLQGGKASEYYHLTNAQDQIVTAMGTLGSNGTLLQSTGTSVQWTASPVVDTTTINNGTLPMFATTLRAANGFGCNGAAVQTPYASGGALAGYVTGANGLDTAAHMQALYNQVVAIRAALVANGIMS